MVPPLLEMIAAAQNRAKLRCRSEAKVRGTLVPVGVVVPWPDSAITPAATSRAGSPGSPTTKSSSSASPPFIAAHSAACARENRRSHTTLQLTAALLRLTRTPQMKSELKHCHTRISPDRHTAE